MAKINREIFIPYIKNICALHLLRRKLNEKTDSLEYQIRKVTVGEKVPAVYEPYYDAVWTKGRVAAVIGAGIWAFPWVVCLLTHPIDSLSFYLVPAFCIAISAGIVFSTLNDVRDTKNENSYKAEIYQSNLDSSRKIKEKNESERNRKLPYLHEQLSECRAAYEEACSVLAAAYATNVIPGQYRNLHSAIYLYEWFSKSMEDDLGMALNTFVLEQIKDKLDVVIRNQGEMILNQQIQLSHQLQSEEEQQRYYQMMEAKLNSLCLTEEENSRNLEMLNQTNSSILWYARQEYIRNM